MKIVKFDARKDENQYPIINPLQIEGDLTETVVTTYEFNEQKRVVKKKHHQSYRMRPPMKDSSDYYRMIYKETMDHKKQMQKVYVPKFMRYKFDVEISGRNKNELGILIPVGKICGYEYKTENTGLYKNFVKNEYKLHKATCTRQNCPVCFRTHSAIRGKSISSKIWGISKLNKLNLRHWTINYRTRNPPGSFREIKDLENKFKKILQKYHSKRKKELCYTLTIHPYSLHKICKKCGKDDISIRDRVCNQKLGGCGNRKFRDPRWVNKWHWHLVTNFYCDQLNYLDLALAEEGMQIQNLSKKSRKYPRGKIHNQQMLERIITYEFSHAMYIPYKARDVCRFLGGFHHGNFICQKETKNLLVTDENGNPYIKVKAKVVKSESLNIEFETQDEFDLDGNGQIQYKYEKVICYGSFRKRTGIEMMRRYSRTGRRKKKRKLKPELDLTMPVRLVQNVYNCIRNI